MKKRFFDKNKVVLMLFFFCLGQMVVAQTPVEKYGQLQIKNGKVSDKDGNPVVLRGMSLFWSGYPEGSSFYNANTVQWLRDDWCVDVVRAAMSVEQGNTNYLGNASAEMAKIKTVIDACIANGLYVLVDFHSHNAPNYLSQAKTFFTEIANEYGNLPNIIYEPYNEPISQDWSSVIKPFHNEIISTIRAIDDNNIIVCGTKNYSQDVDEAANDPVTGTNIAYTLHYYSNSHQESLRQKAINAMNRGVALFVTEYGTTNASGDGGYNEAESLVWWDFLEEHQISSCNWSIGNKGETSAALTPGLQSQSHWSTNQLTTSGKLVREYLKGKCNLVVTTGSVTLSFTGDRSQFDIGESITISAATTVANGTISRVDFFSGDHLIGTDNTSPYSLTTSDLTPGGHDIVAKSYDASGNFISSSPLSVIAVVGTSDVSTTGITDQFESEEQFSETTGDANGTSCDGELEAAQAGIFWFQDEDPETAFSSKATRLGDGALTYEITQAAGMYNVVGFNFGEYCLNGEKEKYSLDLSNDATLSLTVTSPVSNTTTFDIKFQMKDADGTTLAINNSVLMTDGTVDEDDWYKHEIGYSKNHVTPDYVALIPGNTSNFVFDFKDALSINNPNDPSFPDDINTDNSDFDFSKVTEVVIIPVNSEDDGAPTYAPLAFEDQTIIFSGLTMGDPTLGVDFCSTPAAPSAEDVEYCQNDPDVAELMIGGINGLTNKWYHTASGGVASEDTPIPSTAVAGTQTYYVSQATSPTSTCEGPRTALTVDVFEAPTAFASIEEEEPISGPTVNLVGSGTSVGTWSFVSGPVDASFDPSSSAEEVTATGLSEIGVYNFAYTVTGDALCEDAVADLEVNVSTITSASGLVSAGISAYPNPFNNSLVVDCSNTEVESIRVVDVLGRVVYTTSSINKTLEINTSSWNAGMYVLEVSTDDEIIVANFEKR